jgi:hypothetical protein
MVARWIMFASSASRKMSFCFLKMSKVIINISWHHHIQ